MFCPSRQACPALGVTKQVPLGIGRIGSSHRQPVAIASLLLQARPAPPVGVAMGVGVGAGVEVATGVGVETLSGTHRPILPATRYVVPGGHPGPACTTRVQFGGVPTRGGGQLCATTQFGGVPVLPGPQNRLLPYTCPNCGRP